MDETILSESPLVRVTTAHGRLAPCEDIPVYVFRGAVPGLPADATGHVPGPLRGDRDLPDAKR